MAQDFPDDIFERAAGIDRAAELEEYRKRNEALAKAEAEQAAVRKASADCLSARANASILLAEYHRAGLTPPLTDGSGCPTVSLGMLLSTGWTIDTSTGTALLLRPLTFTPPLPAHREDYHE